MPITRELSLDCIEGGQTRARISNRNTHATRIAIIKGYSGPTALGDAVRDNFTLTANGQRLPQLNEPHPSFPDSICLSIEPEMVDLATVKITYEYDLPTVEDGDPTDPSIAQLSVGSTVQEIETERDFQGGQLVVSYTDGVGNPPTLRHQVGRVKKQVPSTYFRYRRRQNFSPGDDSLLYVGKMNSQPVFTDPPHYWLCTGIYGDSFDFGFTYEVTFEFLRNVETWDGVIVYIDPSTNRIPVGATFGNPGPSNPGGLKRVQVYQEIDFYNLGLTF